MPSASDGDSPAALDAFVDSLGERIDSIQEAEHGGDFAEAARRAGELAEKAKRMGLPTLAAAAARVVARCRAADWARLRAEIEALVGEVRRVRLEHPHG